MSGIDDRPGGLDHVLTREERGVAGHRVAEQPLVVAQRHPALLGCSTTESSTGRPAMPSPGRFARAPIAIATCGIQPEANVVAHRRRRLREHDLRRQLELDEHLGGGHLRYLPART